MHINLQLSVIAGRPAINTSGFPGTQGDVVHGIHGIGVNTPKAALVAAITCGLDTELHMPNEAIFTMGIISIIFAIGLFDKFGRSGNTVKGEGVVPKLQVICAVLHT